MHFGMFSIFDPKKQPLIENCPETFIVWCCGTQLPLIPVNKSGLPTETLL